MRPERAGPDGERAGRGRLLGFVVRFGPEAKERGKRGKVLQLLPNKDRAVVEGLMMIKRHQKQKDENTPGEIVEREGSIHVSNLMLATKWEERRSK